MRPGSDLVLFDFDKTLVARDSFLVFSQVAASTWPRRAYALLLAALCKGGVLSNAAYKARVLRRFWHLRSPAEQAAILAQLHRRLGSLACDGPVARLKAHLRRHHRVVVLSASPAFYVRPFVQAWSDQIEVLASQFDAAKEENLYGKRKAEVARHLIEAHQPEVVWVYTDHLSDLPLIEMAHRVGLVRPSPGLVRALRARRIEFEVVTV
jgi:phosphoserine phosphatase